MGFLRRISLITLIILVAVSVFQDLAQSGDPIRISNKENVAPLNFEAIPVKVNPGDTVLSITEELQSNAISTVSIETILDTFESLNPTTSPSDIQIHEIYYFPRFQEQ